MSRRFHFALVLVALLVTSGCTLPGADLTASATPASVDEGALNATGYAVEERGTIALNETLGINGEDRTVGVTNHIVSYQSTDHDGQFVVFTTPSPDIDDAPANPFAMVSERPDVARMFGEINNTTALTVENRRNVTLAGESTRLVTYATTNRSASGTTPVFVHAAVTQVGGDAVVAVGTHPRSVEDGAAIRRLVEGVERGEST